MTRMDEILQWARVAYPNLVRRECCWTMLPLPLADDGARCDDGPLCTAADATPEPPPEPPR
jgi:hypothetical protein